MKEGNTLSETWGRIGRFERWWAPWDSLMVQMVKRLPTMRQTRVQSLGQEDSLEKEMATHSSILAWKIPWTEKPGGLQSMGSQSQTRLSDFTFHFSIDFNDWLKNVVKSINCWVKLELTMRHPQRVFQIVWLTVLPI